MKPQTQIRLIWTTGLVTISALLIAAFGIYTNFLFLNWIISVGFLGLTFLSYSLGYRRLSAVFGVLAIIFNPLVPLHYPRHIWVILDIFSSLGIAQFIYWSTNPYAKGARFEQYVSTLFPEPKYRIKDRTRDTSKFSNRQVDSDSHPDFIFEEIGTGKQFAIECKWRGRWSQGNNGELGIWWKETQSAKYKRYASQSGLPVEIVFGIGGTPNKPSEVYAIELDKVQGNFLAQTLIRSGRNLKN